MKKLLAIAAAAVAAVSACFSQLSVFANEEDGSAVIYDPSIIIYELGDPRVPAADTGNGVVHDLNTSEEECTDLQDEEDAYARPLILCEPGDERVPAIDWDGLDDLHILEESAAGEDAAAPGFYNLMWVGYSYQFSDVQEYVLTDESFMADESGYLFVSTSSIDGPVRISMLEYESGKVVGSWEGDPQTVSGIGFPGKKLSGFYYFKFEPCGAASLSGSGGIFWNNGAGSLWK